MENVTEYVIEPEIADPPPRAARLPLSTNLLLLAASLLFALFIYGGSRALVEGWKLAWLGMSGRPMMAHVTQVITTPSSVKGEPDRQVGLRYVYTLTSGPERNLHTGVARLEMPEDGRSRDAAGTPAGVKQPDTPAAVPMFHVGDSLPLRGTKWLGQPLVSPWQTAPVGKILFLLLCGGLVVGISALLLRRIARWRGHRMRLLRLGVATTGTIVHKEARAEDAPRYYVRYGYDAGKVAIEREEQVSMEQWKRLDVGQTVTVLYDPDQTGDSSLYSLIGKG